MSKRFTLEHRYIEFIPKELEEGVFYISRRFNTASHLCCCGCGEKVVTPLNPAKWRLTDHGRTFSLAPSIGLGMLSCQSHYWIRQSGIDWFPRMTANQTRRAQLVDEHASQVYTGERLPVASTPISLRIRTIRSKLVRLQTKFLFRFRSLWN